MYSLSSLSWEMKKSACWTQHMHSSILEREGGKLKCIGWISLLQPTPCCQKQCVALKWFNKEMMIWILGQCPQCTEQHQCTENYIWGQYVIYSDQCPWAEYLNRSDLYESDINVCHQRSPKFYMFPLETVLEVRNFVVSYTTYYEYGQQNQTFNNSFFLNILWDYLESVYSACNVCIYAYICTPIALSLWKKFGI